MRKIAAPGIYHYADPSPDRNSLLVYKIKTLFVQCSLLLFFSHYCYSRIAWLKPEGKALLTEYGWKRRWRTAYLINVENPSEASKKFSTSASTTVTTTLAVLFTHQRSQENEFFSKIRVGFISPEVALHPKEKGFPLSSGLILSNKPIQRSQGR